MKRLLAVGAMGLVGATLALAQVPRSTIYSRPDLPSEETLRRLNLKMAWSRDLPTLGRADGFASIQVAGKDLLAQTRSGMVVRLDAETGVVRWRQRIGRPYRGGTALGFNARSVYAINATDLYSLSRETGEVRWKYRLPAGASAAPIADDRHVYLATAAGRIYAYLLPPTDVPAETKKDDGSEKEEDTENPQPVERWSVLTTVRLEFTPLQTLTHVMVLSPSGDIRLYDKGLRDVEAAAREESLAVRGRIDHPAGQFGEVAYIGTQEGTLYALDMESSRLVWRYTAGTPIARQPMAMEEDVFVSLKRLGLARISRVDVTDPVTRRSREAGQEVWRNADADRFVASNPKFVYAMDFSGRMLVLDRKRGTKLSRLDTRHYRFPVHNVTTDRIYLASHDGLVVCLHDRDYARPYNHRTQEELGDPVKKALATPVTDPGGKMMTLRQVMNQFEKRYNVKIRVAERAFKERRVENVQAMKIKFPAVKKRPLEEVLAIILAQVGATFDVFDDTIYIIPARPKR
jgi:outer membrane protein assembly factor BamB